MNMYMYKSYTMYNMYMCMMYAYDLKFVANGIDLQ